MGKIESTAVNELIELVSLKPLESDADNALFAPPRTASRDSSRPTKPSPSMTIMGVKPMSPGRAAHGTKTNLVAAGESGGVSRPSRLTGIAPLPAPPPVVSETDGWAVEPTHSKIHAVAPPIEPSIVPSGELDVDMSDNLEDDEPAEPPMPSVSVQTTLPALPVPRNLPPLPTANLHRTVLGTPAPVLARGNGRKTLPPPVRMRGSTGAITVDAGTIDAVTVEVNDADQASRRAQGALDSLGRAPTMSPEALQRAKPATLPPLPLPRIAPTVVIAPALPLPKIAPTIAMAPMVLEEDTPTEYFDRPDDELDAPPRNKLILPMIAVGVAGALLGTILALRGGGGTSQPVAALAAKVETASPAVAVAPPVAAPQVVAPAVTPSAPAVAAPAVTPSAPAVSAPAVAAAPQQVAAAVVPRKEVAATPVLVDVRFDSEPDGATVMIVDRGSTTLLGTTPTLGSLDPSRSYDVVFTSAGHPTRVEHFDPKATHAVAISYTHAAPAHVAAIASAHPQEVAAPKESAKPAPVKAAPVAAPVKVATAPAAKPAEHKPAAKAVAAADGSHGGGGVLMISTKPPCQIFIDGKPTGLVTPQRSISLAAGTHSITLINAQSKVKKTVAVEITASKSTKLIQDLMKK
jgi:hypothetical protein